MYKSHFCTSKCQKYLNHGKALLKYPIFEKIFRLKKIYSVVLLFFACSFFGIAQQDGNEEEPKQINIV
ncbi:MAG TPA: hypothetical protein DCM40_39720, partial [Maribacter sp.]|nr:hypothetical protein [Maribacter sp.]